MGLRMKDLLGKGRWSAKIKGNNCSRTGTDEAWRNKDATQEQLIDVVKASLLPGEQAPTEFTYEEYVKEGRKIVSKVIKRFTTE
jgi:hypothetical protein